MAFLDKRTFYVGANSIRSKVEGITRGVPQGSVLSPMLFNIFINDLISSNIAGGKVDMQLYADDGVVWTHGSTFGAKMGYLQEACDHITQWSKNNCIEFSKDKTNLVIFGREDLSRWHPPEVVLCGWKVQLAAEYKYLGLTLQSNGKWDTHFNDICSKANKTCGWIRHHNRMDGPPSIAILVKILKAIIQPQLSYAIECWNPNSTQYATMDKLVMRGYKTVLKVSRSTTHDNIRRELNILTMSQLRNIAQRRLWLRATNIKEQTHPTVVFFKSIEHSKTGKGSKAKPHLEWDLNQNQPSQEERKLNKLKQNKTLIPQYMYRVNPAGWISARIKHNQSWGYRFGNKGNTDLGCGHPRCKMKDSPTTPEHILLHCPQFDNERQQLKETLRRLQIPMTMDSMMGTFVSATKAAKATADSNISKYITDVFFKLPFCFWKSNRDSKESSDAD
jgi:Reverse transcriptase (RNA-dependent DNA polymerase)